MKKNMFILLGILLVSGATHAEAPSIKGFGTIIKRDYRYPKTEARKLAKLSAEEECGSEIERTTSWIIEETEVQTCEFCPPPISSRSHIEITAQAQFSCLD